VQACRRRAVSWHWRGQGNWRQSRLKHFDERDVLGPGPASGKPISVDPRPPQRLRRFRPLITVTGGRGRSAPCANTVATSPSIAPIWSTLQIGCAAAVTIFTTSACSCPIGRYHSVSRARTPFFLCVWRFWYVRAGGGVRRASGSGF